MATYNCTSAHYRQNGGSWWSPLTGSKVPTGWNGTGSNKYETRLAFDFASIRATNVNYYITAATLYVRVTADYSAASGYMRVTDSGYTSIASGGMIGGSVNTWIAAPLDSALIAALVNGSATYIGTYNVSNGTYYTFYTTATYTAYLDITWAPRAPQPQPPGEVYSPGTLVDDVVYLDWSDGSDTVFPTNQLYYEANISNYIGLTWGAAFTSSQGQSATALNIRSYLGLAAGQIYYNSNMKLRVRTKTPDYGGSPYYSGYAYSTGTFIVDYRFQPTDPTPVTPGTVTIDTPTFDWSDSASPNGVFTAANLMYEFQLSTDGGGSYGPVYTTAAGVSYQALNLRTYFTLQPLQYAVNGSMRFRVRAKSPVRDGQTYYSGWVQSGTFWLDYRIVPSAPASLTPSKSNPYEGEAINFTVGRPVSYNTHDAVGAVMQMTYYVKLYTGTALANATEPVTSSSKVVPYTVGALTAVKADLSTNIRAYCIDAQSQQGTETANVAFTIRRFRKPTISLDRVTRDTTSAVIEFDITDTGYGASQSNSQINKVQYKLGSGSWTDATLGAWSGLHNSFTLSSLDEGTEYTLQLRAENVAPSGTSLANITGDAITGIVPTYAPRLFIWKDSITGESGIAAKAGYFGNDFTEPVDPGCLVVQNDITTDKLRILSTGDASFAGTTHGLQIGATGGSNVILDNNEIMCRNNGAASSLYINNDGGNVYLSNGNGIYARGHLIQSDGYHSYLDINSGWVHIDETWTYYNSNHVTVPSDATGRFQIGDKIAFTQSGVVKFFYVIGVSSTRLTLNGGTGVSVANSAITNPYFSRAVRPWYFPNWMPFAMDIKGSGGSKGSYAESATSICQRFRIDGTTCFLKRTGSISNKGSWSGQVLMSLPATPGNLAGDAMYDVPCWAANGANASTWKASIRWQTTMDLTFLDALNASFLEWTELSTGDWIIMNTSFEMANTA